MFEQRILVQVARPLKMPNSQAAILFHVSPAFDDLRVIFFLMSVPNVKVVSAMAGEAALGTADDYGSSKTIATIAHCMMIKLCP